MPTQPALFRAPLLVTLASAEFHRNLVAVSTYLRVMNISQKICVSPYHSRSSTQTHRQSSIEASGSVMQVTHSWPMLCLHRRCAPRKGACRPETGKVPAKLSLLAPSHSLILRTPEWKVPWGRNRKEGQVSCLVTV